MFFFSFWFEQFSCIVSTSITIFNNVTVLCCVKIRNKHKVYATLSSALAPVLLLKLVPHSEEFLCVADLQFKLFSWFFLFFGCSRMGVVF